MDVIRVTNTDDNGTGSLRDAINTAAADDIIVFDDAILPAAISLTSWPIIINKNLTINGPGADLLTISGNNDSRIFITIDGEITIRSISFTNGFGYIGGAILNKGAVLTVESCRFFNNTAILSSGAVANFSPGATELRSCKFFNNSSSFSGAIGNFSGTTTLRNSILANNSVDTNGGAVVNRDSGTVTITRSSFTSNIADNGILKDDLS